MRSDHCEINVLMGIELEEIRKPRGLEWPRPRHASARRRPAAGEQAAADREAPAVQLGVALAVGVEPALEQQHAARVAQGTGSAQLLSSEISHGECQTHFNTPYP